MTRTAGHDRAILPPHPHPVRSVQPALQSRSGVYPRTIELCWTISTLASRSLLQEHACACKRTDADSQLDITDCRWSVDHQHQLEHIDIAGVVHCTLGHVEQGSTGEVSGSKVEKALFVRTPWLARVGLKPGTYALSGMRVLS